MSGDEIEGMGNNDSVTARLRALRIRSGLSMGKTAKALKLKGASSYQRYEDPTLFTKPVLPLLITQKLAELFAGQGVPPIDKREVMMLAGVDTWTNPQLQALDAQELIWCIGEVAAGIWREAMEWPRDDWLPLTSSLNDKRYPLAKRAAVRVRGDSMDLVYPEGSYVTFVRLADIGRGPQPGERVLAVRRRHNLIEATIKEYTKDAKGRRWLLPRSSNPSHAAIPLNDNADEGETTEIIGLVVASQRVE